jgi:hypothetical protein
MQETTDNAMKTCPQCDGTGREELGKVIMCRKCAGSGVTKTVAKTASILCGGGIEKIARNTEDDDEFQKMFGDITREDQEAEPVDMSRLEGSGVNQFSGIADNKSEDELRMDLVSIMGSLSPVSLLRCVETAAASLQMDTQKEKTTWVNADNTPSMARLTKAVYKILPMMNSAQLKELFATVTNIM